MRVVMIVHMYNHRVQLHLVLRRKYNKMGMICNNIAGIVVGIVKVVVNTH